MNAARRKEIGKAIGLLQTLSATLDEVKSLVEGLASEEREYYDNMHENLQGGDKGQAADNAATQLEEIQSSLEELDIDDLVGKLEEARDS